MCLEHMYRLIVQVYISQCNYTQNLPNKTSSKVIPTILLPILYTRGERKGGLGTTNLYKAKLFYNYGRSVRPGQLFLLFNLRRLVLSYRFETLHDNSYNN